MCEINIGPWWWKLWRRLVRPCYCRKVSAPHFDCPRHRTQTRGYCSACKHYDLIWTGYETWCGWCGAGPLDPRVSSFHNANSRSSSDETSPGHDKAPAPSAAIPHAEPHGRRLRPRTDTKTGMPTRNDIRWHSPAEKAIREAMLAVEKAGASEALTKAVGLLGDAMAWVADHEEGIPASEHYPRPAPSAGAVPRHLLREAASHIEYLMPEPPWLDDRTRDASDFLRMIREVLSNRAQEDGS